MSESLVPEVFTGIVQLDTADSKATREDAFRVYMTTVGPRAGGRSIRHTADLLGLPRGTVLSWAHRDQWRARARDTDFELTEGIADASQAAVVAQQLQNINYLAGVRDSEDESVTAKDKIAATKLLMSEFKDVSAAVAQRAAKRAEVEDVSAEDLEDMVQSPEGVAQLLARMRAATGKG